MIKKYPKLEVKDFASSPLALFWQCNSVTEVDLESRFGCPVPGTKHGLEFYFFRSQVFNLALNKFGQRNLQDIWKSYKS